ncbi:PDR/VanB family oxidoreductase [Pseudarthrobacter raffinosi]|uniref:PDR/VanB family oxidoreductase n=1 Tax=Pseudarthrobacter raffinosi TaxID=2953651 RepID=UPI00208DE155|nr:PDR/VanB family oxidoreductase [Pseudarthrobacter sp. MDT3-9]MCO4252126.1 PDR/VanB family oxidoreductase [Pseudarthrobacter sp. MDT3-9]
MTAPNSMGWQAVRVVACGPVADGIQRIVLESSRVERAAPGSHLDVEVAIEGGSEVRSYSVVNTSEDGRRHTLAVHRAPQSRGGSEFMHRLRVGDELNATRPLQNFPLRVGAARYTLIAGGIGITAMVAMASMLRRLGADYTLVYVGRTRARMAFLAELELEHGDRLRACVDDEDTSLNVAQLVDQIANDDLSPAIEAYMCGPIRLMDAVRRKWSDTGLPLTNLRFETFGNSGWFDPEEFIVRIPRLGIETAVAPDSSMLEAIQGAGAEMMFDCLKGECGLCEVKVLGLDGCIDHRDVFFSEEQKNASRKMCACVSRVVRPVSSDVETSGQSASRESAIVTIDIT